MKGLAYKSEGTTREAVCRIALFFYLAFFIAGFYFIEIPSSRHSSFIRGGLLVIFVLSLISFFRERDVKTSMKRSVLCFFNGIDFSARLFVYALFLLFLYFLIQSFFFGDYAAARRIAVIFLFVSLVAVAIARLRFDTSRFVFFIGLLCVALSSCYTFYFISEDVGFLSHPLRVSYSGLDWYASYNNTVIAGQFWSFLFMGGLWSYIKTRRKLLASLFLASCFIMLFAIYHTAARTAWVAVSAGMVSSLFFVNKEERSRLLLVLLPLFLLALGYFLVQPDAVIREGLTYRDHIWLEHIKSITGLSEWFFGKGVSAPTNFVELPNGQISQHAHSIYIETIYMGGIVGLALLCFLFGSSFYYLFVSEKKRNEFGFINSVLLSACVSMIFDFHGLIDTPNLVWLWLWLPLSLLLSCVFSFDPELGDGSR